MNECLVRRRPLLLLPLAGPTALVAALAPALARAADAAALQALRGGGVVLALRHALAPGTFDPPGFRLDDCSTQRNLDDTGRAQARTLGARLRREQLAPAAVRSSPWCRCLETAQLAFGGSQTWPALGSPRSGSDATSPDHLRQLRAALAAAAGQPGFEVWVTHGFVLHALAGIHPASGEGLVLRAGRAGATEVVARLAAL